MNDRPKSSEPTVKKKKKIRGYCHLLRGLFTYLKWKILNTPTNFPVIPKKVNIYYKFVVIIY